MNALNSFESTTTQSLVSCRWRDKTVYFYVNELQRLNLGDLYCILSADDTNVFIKHTNYTFLIDRLNRDLNNIVEWFKVKKLTLNIKQNIICCFIDREYKYELSMDQTMPKRFLSMEFV